ncbi:hypothetical protein GN244_ATG20790 [Phytophthora infestans]|uniref:Uncharacterized protein n=1 Tax=Phytophthora infestans TaxID=4787 RepID=A0A833VTB0_PHYIN|nr:hypothetical protein GN244_ATG20790 [Phytophthora infestans]
MDVQGLPPEEQPSLEEAELNARKAHAARREAVSAKTKSPIPDQLSPDPSSQDTHQFPEDSKPGRGPEAVEGESVSGQASVGGTNMDESLMEGRVSDSSPPVQDAKYGQACKCLSKPKHFRRS